jgi:uncharacterized protein (TIGR02421 family)
MGNISTSSKLTPLQATIRELSDRLVAAQCPLRILSAIKWDTGVEQAFFAAGCRQQPPVTRDHYSRRPLPFDADTKRQELLVLERDIRRQLGPNHAAGSIMLRMCREYREIVDLLVHRGTRLFNIISQRLYGSAADRIHAGQPSLAGLVDHLPNHHAPDRDHELLDAPQVVGQLSRRLTRYFDETNVRVCLSNRIVADAAAGCDYIKIRRDARFTARDVRLLEVHEGWVHLGTTLNGRRQPICTFLSRGSPSSTITQEGLAVLTEVFALASHPGRIRRLTNRVAAVAMAEDGATFLDVFRFFVQEGCAPKDSYQQTLRVFRGSLPAGCGPFTKDLCYSHGFRLIHDFLRSTINGGLLRHVALLFCGKTNLADFPALAQLADEGLVEPPRYVPPAFLYSRAA